MRSKTQIMTATKSHMEWGQFYWFVCSVCCVLWLGLHAPLVSADPKISQQADWHYTLRPNDNLKRIASDVLNNRHDWNDLVRHNRIENPNNLLPGSIIKIPIEWLKQQPKPATVLSTTGSTLIKRARDAKYKVLKSNTAIRVGDEISTRNGTTLIKFADGTLLRLEENSTLMFNKLSHFGNTGMVDTQLRLKKGSLTTEVTPLIKGSRYEIKTPSAVAAVRGTKFRLEASPSGTKLEVLEGEVEFSHEHGSQNVPAGQGAEIRRGIARIETKALDPAPKPRFAGDEIKELPATLAWDEQKPANQFEYELVDKTRDGQRVKAGTLSEPEIELDNLRNGEYSVALHAVDEDGFGGLDATSNLSVNVEQDIPTLIAPADGSMIDTPKPNFNFKFSRASTSGVLELASDEAFQRVVQKQDVRAGMTVTLSRELQPGTYYWRIVTDIIDGKETDMPFNRFSVRGLMKPVKILSVNYIDNQVGLFWNTLAEAKGYILQLSDDKNFSNILKEETLGKNSAHLRLKEGKTYYARVKGIGNELYTSEFGPVKELAIEE